MINVEEIFNKIEKNSGTVRIDDIDSHDIFLGREEYGRLIMFIISSAKPSNISSSNFIEIQRGLRHDGKWTLSFILKDMEYYDIFCHFCNDMIEYAVENSGIDLIISFSDRYLKWQSMLKKNISGLLSKEEVKGLIGEVYFLINYMIDLYGLEKSVYSWVGMEYNKHDFVVDELWYEIKTVKNSAYTVIISSIEQLECISDGKLIINYIDDTSITDINKITLNEIIDKLFNIIESESLKIVLKNKLLEYGYISRKEYDDYAFKFIKMEVYNVDGSFPSVKRYNIPDAVNDLKYELIIKKIQDYKV